MEICVLNCYQRPQPLLVFLREPSGTFHFTVKKNNPNNLISSILAPERSSEKEMTPTSSASIITIGPLTLAVVQHNVLERSTKPRLTNPVSQFSMCKPNSKTDKIKENSPITVPWTMLTCPRSRSTLVHRHIQCLHGLLYPAFILLLICHVSIPLHDHFNGCITFH